MKQQINLYQEQFYEKKLRLPARQMILLTIVSLLLIAGAWYWLEKNNQLDFERNIRLGSELGSLTKEVESLKKGLESQAVDQNLLMAVSDANRQLGIKQRLLAMVEASTAESAVRFSALMEGLARRYVEGMWFVHINISDGGHQLMFEGSTLDPGLVPVFIERLQHEAAYSGREFQTVILNRNEEHGQKIDFILGTATVDEKTLLTQQSLVPHLSAIGVKSD